MAIIIGITGGIGSGKSVISSLLRIMDIPVYDCDREAKRLMNTDTRLKEQLLHLAGSNTYTEEGTLNRPHLASFMFGNPQRVKQVNALVHPAVRTDFTNWVSRQTAKIVGMESAILFESGMDTLVHYIFYIWAPLDTRIQRVIKRDQVTTEQVQQRIASQWPDEKKRQRSHVIIRNCENESLIEQLKRELSSLN